MIVRTVPSASRLTPELELYDLPAVPYSMEVTCSPRGDRTIITVTGRLDAATAPGLDDTLNGIIGQGNTALVFDFSGLAYISSAGLRVLLSARKKVQPLNGTVVLCGLQPFVREVFEMTGFTRIFPVVSNPEEMP